MTSNSKRQQKYNRREPKEVLCGECRYDFFCMRNKDRKFKCRNFLKVEKGKTSADYTK